MKVSVILMTYNHERFIAQAIESVLAQEGVDYEIVVTEDCSTDRTREVIQRYAQQYPDRFRLFYSERNQHDGEVLIRAFRAARGEYIAVLDGDDYWTSPHKLRRQVDLLDARRDFALCFHATTVVNESGVAQGRLAWNKPTAALTDLLRTNIIATASVMYRRETVTEFPEWQNRVQSQDWAIHILFASSGDIGYIDEPMAARRMHPGGQWVGQSYRMQLQHDIAFYRTLRPNLPIRYHDLIARRLAWNFAQLAIEYGEEEAERARAAVRDGLLECRNDPSLLALAYAPGAYRWVLAAKRALLRAVGRQSRALPVRADS
jgi:glycosyltransferase involved in cell wall biosynthesis